MPWMGAVAYLGLFLLLDWVSYIRPLQGFNITPWNPQPALAIALLMYHRGWLWVVVLGLLSAEIAIRGAPSNWLAVGLATSALALTYAATARALSVRLDPVEFLHSRRDLAWFTGLVIAGSLASGVIYVSVYVAAGLGPTGSFAEAVLRYWVGDAVGLTVTLPLVLTCLSQSGRSALRRTLQDQR